MKVVFGTNQSPLGDENDANFCFGINPMKNQPIPKRGRKKHLPKSVGALSYDMKFMCLTMEYILQIYF